MKRSIKSIVLYPIFAVIIISGFLIAEQVEASDDYQTLIVQNTPQYTGTRYIQASLSIFGGTASCGSTLEVFPGYKGYLTMYLQKKSSGSWSNVTSWSGSTSNLLGISLNEIYSNLTLGTTYRVHAIGMIYQNGVFVETVSVTSPERTR